MALDWNSLATQVAATVIATTVITVGAILLRKVGGARRSHKQIREESSTAAVTTVDSNPTSRSITSVATATPVSIPTSGVTHAADKRKPKSAHATLPGKPFHSVGQRATLHAPGGETLALTVCRFTPGEKIAFNITDESQRDYILSANGRKLALHNNALFNQSGRSEYHALQDAYIIIPDSEVTA